MSDKPDPSSLPKWEALLRQLEQTHGRLEQAHVDYLEASAESQRALQRVIDAFGDISETIRMLVPEPESVASTTEPARSETPSQPAVDEADEEASPVQAESSSIDTEIDTHEGLPDDGEPDGHLAPPDAKALSAPDSTPDANASSEADHSQNALPAHLHSRGVAIPDDGGAPKVFESPNSPPSRRDQSPTQSGLRIDQPILKEAAMPEAPTPFSGLNRENRILLTNDGFGVAAILSDLLSKAGYRVRVGSRRPDFSSPTDTVIFLGSLRAPSDLDDAMSVIDDAIYTAEKMTTRLMQPDSGFAAVIDTAGGFGLDAFDPVAAPYGALLGLVRLLDRRHPSAHTRLIDLDGGRLSNEQIANLLATELLEGGNDSPIGLGTDHRQSVAWESYAAHSHPAPWLTEDPAPLVYMPGPNAVLATAVERLAIAHELPVALLRRRHSPARLAKKFDALGIEIRRADYDLNRLFSAMDFLDTVRRDYGPVGAIVAESIPANDPDDLARWEVMRPPIDEFNALLAMTINDPLQLLGVGIAPKTPPVVASALRYFARAESLRRNDHLRVRLTHMRQTRRQGKAKFNPRDFALTEFLGAAEPLIAEARFRASTESP